MDVRSERDLANAERDTTLTDSKAAAKARARKRRRRRLFPILALLVLLSGYLYLDVRDVVPGFLTDDEPWPEQDPFPQAQPVTTSDLSSSAPGLDDGAPLPTAQALSSLTDSLLDDDRAGPDPSVMITDVATGEVLLAENADDPRPPASAMKLLTGVAALQTFGPAHTFTTSVLDDGAGQITLVAGGDITLAEEEGDPSNVRGYAGMADLAQQVADELAAAGTTEVSLVLAADQFTGPLLAPNWDDVDVAGGWAMPIMPIAVDLGRQEGTDARQEDPAMHAADVFADRLEDLDITVADVSRGEPSGDQVIGEVHSAPLGEMVAYNLQWSDNPLTEVIGRMVALEVGQEPSFAGAGLAVLQVLEGMGVDTEGVELVDVSGLSSLSDTNATIFTQTVMLAASGEHPQLADAIRGLPVGGLEGTLQNRMSGTTAAGLVAAKTGTLPRVVSLSGLVHTVDGRLLAFTVLTGDFEVGGGYLARLAVDDWAARLAACGCS